MQTLGKILLVLLSALGSLVSPSASATTPLPTKVLLIVEENHDSASAQAGMPYLVSQGRAYGYATNYSANSHPSLPNYLAMSGGSTFGITDDRYPVAHPISGQSVFGQAIGRAKTAKTYAEGMPSNCYQSNNLATSYLVRHAPWPYYVDERANCNKFDVPSGTPALGALRNDVNAGTLPTVGMLTPNSCNDAHDCSLATADNWLKGWLPVLMNGPDYRAGRLVIIVTFDEAGRGSAANSVYTVVISPYTTHVVSPTPYTHYSWARYCAELTVSPPLRSAASANSLRPAFHI